MARMYNLKEEIGSIGTDMIDALATVAGVCDGAVAKDGQGFNRLDNEAGLPQLIKELYECHPDKVSVTFKVLFQLHKVAIFYQRQIREVAGGNLVERIYESQKKLRVKYPYTPPKP